jgi:hypothetical protein
MIRQVRTNGRREILITMVRHCETLHT